MKPTLIIVDDDLKTREQLYSILVDDFEILALATNGQEAVQAVRTHRPRLVVMDVVMPVLSGIDATKAILAESAEPPIVVMVSGMTDESIVLKALKAGAKEYLFKPIKEKKLKKVLWRLYELAA